MGLGDNCVWMLRAHPGNEYGKPVKIGNRGVHGVVWDFEHNGVCEREKTTHDTGS